MPQISPQFMRDFSTGVDLRFNRAFEGVAPLWPRIATEATSTTRENAYPRLGDIPGVREWIGDRVVHSLSASKYTITNRTFEQTLSVSREDIEDDQLGLFNTGVDMLARNAAEFPDLLAFGLLARGETAPCYDGQYFFDTDHEGFDAAGNPVSVSNFAAGGGPGWYLIDTRRGLLPLIFQRRRAFAITAKTALTDDNVFNAGEFVWGTDGRCNVGFGLWQVAYKSRLPLTPENYNAARVAMASLRRRSGAPLAVAPNLLLVPTSLEAAARTLLNAEQIAGSTNTWRGTAELLVSPHLA